MNHRGYQALACGIMAICVPAFAGPLNPPAGPVASTGLTLSDVEPRIAINATNTPAGPNSLFKITQPGSYYLTGNVQGVSSKRGIDIAASDVTIDLRGFEVVGVSGSSSGILTSVTGLRNVTIRNGTVRGWGINGIDFSSALAESAVVEGVHADSNTNNGIRPGARAVVRDCTAAANGGGGFSAGEACVFNSCTATGAGGAGFAFGAQCVLTDCTAIGCTSGFIAGSSANACVLSHCNARQCSGNAFIVNDGSSIDHCVARDNTGAFGFSTGPGCVVTNCISAANTSSATSSGGFTCGFGNRVIGCSAYGNLTTAASPTSSTGLGFLVTTGSLVQDCTANGNAGDGIRASTRCSIVGNLCEGNGTGVVANDGAGIHTTAGSNRIEQNHCVANDRGIDVDAAGSVIFRNTCTLNTLNFSVAASNTILVVIGTNAGAVSGDSGGLAPGSTDPNANFTR